MILIQLYNLQASLTAQQRKTRFDDLLLPQDVFVSYMLSSRCSTLSILKVYSYVVTAVGF